MKAERRRELKANALIWHLQGLPQKIKQYQSQISLVIIVLALGMILIQYRWRTAEERLAAAQNGLAIANQDLSTLRSMGLRGGMDFVTIMKVREDRYAEGVEQADEALQKAPDSQPLLKAQALLAKGDLNFEMANFPELPGAATQPGLRPSESMDDLLSAANDAYSQALRDYGDVPMVFAAARFGLAAVAENRSQWDAASAQYQAIISSDAAKPFKEYAQQRLDILPQLEHPAAIGLSPTTQAATK